MIIKKLKDLDYVPGQLQPDPVGLPKWVTESKDRFNEILSIVSKAKKMD